jgi:pimeloyl-ACP methyl ester carboxylesterase
MTLSSVKTKKDTAMKTSKLGTLISWITVFVMGLAVVTTLARADNLTDVSYRTVTIEDVDIFYREAGNPDNPTLLLLHGFPTSSHMFRDLIVELADEYHLIAPDYPGYGFSSMPSVDEFDYSFDNIARIIEKFTDEIELERFSLYLMDYGAPVGFRIATSRPERIESLIVQNGNAYVEGIDNNFWEPIQAYWKDRDAINQGLDNDW